MQRDDVAEQVGYAQRARFYGGISAAGRLLFAKGTHPCASSWTLDH
jgi:hypothetical protein